MGKGGSLSHTHSLSNITEYTLSKKIIKSLKDYLYIFTFIPVVLFSETVEKSKNFI